MKKTIAFILIIVFLLTCNFIAYSRIIHQLKSLETTIQELQQPIEPVVMKVINDLPEPPEEDPVIQETPEPEPEPVVEETPTPVSTTPSSLATMIAKVVWGEARGLGQTEQSCVVWTILNRADAWGKSVESIITAPNQFYYDPGFPTIDDHGRDITVLVQEILTAWENGDNSIRTLPEGYFFYVGDGSHNYFYADYNNRVYWDYSYGSPYSD